MNRSAVQDLVLAAILAAMALFVLITMGSQAGIDIAGSGEVTHATLPMLYAGLLLLLTLLLVGKALLSLYAPADRPPAFSLAPKVWLRIAGTLGLLIAFVLLFKALPFLPLTAAFLFLLFLLYGHRRLLTAAMVAVIGAVAFDALFVRVLNLPI